jgi:5-methylcytosine-specific restriction endonuclease McrA
MVGVLNHGPDQPRWRIAARARHSERLQIQPEYRRRIRDQQRAGEERRLSRVKTDPEYRARFLTKRRNQAMRRMEKLRADAAALEAYRKRQREARDPEKRRASAAVAQARRRDRLKVDFVYRERRREIRRASGRRRAERLRTDPDYHERFRDRQKAWYRKNRERLRAAARGREAARRDALNARARQKYAEDPARWLLYAKGWKARNREKAAAYQRASDHRRRSAGPGFTSEEWRALLERYEHRCAYCGVAGNLEADHRTPICRGGSNNIENILPACRRCNRTKFSMTEQEFRERRAGSERVGGPIQQSEERVVDSNTARDDVRQSRI